MPVGRFEPPSTGRFQERERAVENIYFAQEERTHLLKRLEGMVKEGKLDQATYDKLKTVTGDPHHCIGVEVLPGKYQDTPTEFHDKQEAYIYEYKKGDKVPTPDEIERMKHVPHTDMGPGRYAPAGASIFSLAEGERLAAEPIKLSPAAAARLAKAIAEQQAEVESPTLFGYRVLPKTMSPGRAFFLSSMLAVVGTAALVVAVVKEMGVGGAPQGGPAETRGLSPMGQRISNWFSPWRERVAHPEAREPSQPSEFVGKLREAVSK